jgi:hypothetical protein
MFRTKAWVTTCLVLPVPNVAVMVRSWTATLLVTAGIPEMVAVPLWSLTNVTPLGSLPFFLMVGVGVPYVVTRNEKAKPARPEALGLLVMASPDGGPTSMHSSESRLAALVLSADAA